MPFTLPIKIIEAGVDDAAIVAQLHSLSWQASYAGILPDDYLKNKATGERASYWSGALPSGDYALVLLVKVQSAPAAFIAIKQQADAGYDATIEHLHVLPQMKGRGLGRLLLKEAASRLIADGLTSVCLWVFEDNKPAIGFYESLGGVTDAHGTDKFLGGDARDRRIGWHDLSALRAACEDGVKS